MIRTAFKKKKRRKCAIKTCRAEFEPRSISHKVCGKEECAIAWGLQEREKRLAKVAKEERAATKRKKQEIKTRTEWADEAQDVVNRYVNLRDWGKPCISCDKPHTYGSVRNASHYKSRGAYSAIRFHLWNIHSSCYRCNKELSGNISEYRPRLIAKIGIDKVEFLENHERVRKYSVEYLQRIKKIFAKKVRRLERKLNEQASS